MFKSYTFRIIITLLIPVYSIHVHAIGEPVPWILLKKILPANPIIIEAGAQFGEDTQWMSQLWPQGKIYAFEPSPESFAELQKIAAKYHNITATQIALSNTKEELPFYLAGGASSLLKPQDSFNNDYFHSDLNHPIIVPVVTLDEWAANNNVTTIDFMWLDMEGNELNALEGALNSLQNVKLIYTEVNLQKFWHGCAMYDDVKAWMEKHGFTEIWSDIVPHWHGNVLFINTNL
ncbi:MAG TPA: FkbM family methyltransferase [Candidatus Babeliales bacterium]|nr:FkbM family methyltransferase [Candidatus Babeliales bacterium]HLC07497.1 FkbM family methyltransferase [Candidatus Babeliales bacterium]